MNRSGAYDIMEREYITAPVGQEDQFTITAIAGRYGRAKSSVARMSRLKHWKEKRAAYRRQTGEIVTELDSDAYAGRLHQIHEKFIKAAELTLDDFIARVEAGDVKTTAGDVEKMVKLVREIVNKPDGGEDHSGGIPGLNLSPELARDLFGRLEGLARERLESGTGRGDPIVVSGAESEGGRLRVR